MDPFGDFFPPKLPFFFNQEIHFGQLGDQVADPLYLWRTEATDLSVAYM